MTPTADFRDYFDGVLDVLIGLTAPIRFSRGPTLEQFSATLGLLEAQLEYPDGQRLSLSLSVDNSSGSQLWRHYSFHLQDQSGVCVFRYDNAGHHPALAHFPHHKHVGLSERPEPALQPTVHQLAREVVEHLRSR